QQPTFRQWLIQDRFDLHGQCKQFARFQRGGNAMGMTTVTSPVALWRTLCSNAGLELRLKNGKPGRDADIEAALRKALAVPGTARSLDAWLAADAGARKPRVSMECFLVELLKGQVGFARMMQDILATLVAADARRATHSL